MNMADTTKTIWKIDPAHTEIQFRAKHLVISTVTGGFHSFEGKVKTRDDDFENAAVTFAADVDSISTNKEQRDSHLKSDDFFNADAYPQLTFVSTSVEKTGDQQYKMIGDLTIRNVTKEIGLNVMHGGTVTDQNGDTKAGFEIEGSLNRKEFGLRWDEVTEAGNVIVGDKIKLLLNVEVVKSQ
jgi:polyisoprenoid-binding protein YceI